MLWSAVIWASLACLAKYSLWLLTSALSTRGAQCIEQRKNVIKHILLLDSPPDCRPQFIGPCKQQQRYCCSKPTILL
ncbi:hypothetical protein GQ55_4G101500 [Panicum hallii var. hallii]|uniref:Secreted protein n=1 Tax=Panicum hallii var. hallii TaxID=1504633 RepID=A0A2T7DX59_9POAL|nr:hypothetical protein GQ55_4G101500 [Panicum hallii var. hallii]